MIQAEQFEVLVLGSGAGGKLIAWHMAQSGRRTAVVERRWIGGSCPNIACMPTKNQISSASTAHVARHGARHGTISGAVAVDLALVRRRKREMVERQVAKHLRIYQESGAELIMGSGRFVAPKTLEVKLNDGGTRVLAADKIFLNVGTHAAVPNVPGLEAARPLTHIEALELDYVPKHLIVIGGGYSGLELAQAFRRFGSAVTVVESGPRLMTREDVDVSDEIRRVLGDEGIQILAGAQLLQVGGRSGDTVTLSLRTPSGEQQIDGSDILVAAGRIPNTAGIGLKEAGVELDGRGYVSVNGRLETSAPDVWAVGECAGSPQFTHISEDDFRIIRDNLAGGHRSTGDRLVPYCMFTDPPLARVGLSEGEAKRQGVLARVATLPMDSVLGAQATDQRQGFMKVVVGNNDDRILGFTMIGASAGEVMAAVQTAMLAGLAYSSLADADFAHPTMAEGLSSLFSSVPPRSVPETK
ncbi:FAD-dependent oxidoreductase [Bradyrhizobium septentrionale]|uniref:FAD-dependent oxidoreductase n=1 Tax=Bradyrhizobium septentrionale TaxID=1404411 RepID=A0A973W1M5_9BRAD|nr:FAD-dependent oxidoreductase [Bradyrhizobium septentrionale]UGY14362.1 FAD-dependent oxidoreductase [Bradyrhizobium septentrionale]UGY22930.1 FAD-dependent oxidoreductase [Bradyrhizobium septentrionale]